MTELFERILEIEILSYDLNTPVRQQTNASNCLFSNRASHQFKHLWLQIIILNLTPPENLEMILHRTPQKQTFESIKQKYCKDAHTGSASPFPSYTPASLKANHTFSDPKFGQERSKSPIKQVSPLKLKSVNSQDPSKKDIERIRQKFCNQEYVSNPSYYTQRGNNQRAFNKEPHKRNKQTIWTGAFQLQSSTLAKEYTVAALPSNTTAELNKYSPIRKYLDSGEPDGWQGHSARKDSSEIGKERLRKLKQQRDQNNQTITNIQNIMKNIKATLQSNK